MNQITDYEYAELLKLGVFPHDPTSTNYDEDDQ